MKSLLHISETELKKLGIVEWGYTQNSIPNSFEKYLNWLDLGQHGSLSYLADERKNKRSDLKNIYPEFESALVFLFSYQETKKWMLDNDHHQVAAYALGFDGIDYHFEVKRRLDVIFNSISSTHNGIKHFISLDVQPVLERDLAFRAGLGWFGKNSMLINKKEGSYFIIGSLLLNQKLSLSSPQLDVDHCGQCNKCVEACPTLAINGETRTLDASKCISTFTIETFKDVAPPEGVDKSRGEFFGCDICQDVCPWNRKPLERVKGLLNLKLDFLFLKSWFYEMKISELFQLINNMTNRGLKKQLKFTSFDRPGKMGWLKNLKNWIKISTENDS
jgi:epoxyqueuosine reductase